MAHAVKSLAASNFYIEKIEITNSFLPDELFLKIFELLDITSLAMSARSCKKLHQLSQDAHLGKYLCVRDFFLEQGLTTEEKNWKLFYQKQIGMDYLNIPFPGKQGGFSI